MGEAFSLTAEYEGTVDSLDEDGEPVTVTKFRGATFALTDGTTVNVGEALEAGNGVIVTDDPEWITHLETAPYLKHVKAPEQAETIDSLSARRLADLRRLPEARTVDGVDTMSKAHLIAAIEAQRAGQDPNEARAPEDPVAAQDPAATGDATGRGIAADPEGSQQ